MRSSGKTNSICKTLQLLTLSDWTVFIPVQMTSSTPRGYCEYKNGRISRRYLTRTVHDPQHDIRTDKIGSRHDEWRRKDSIDLQCSTRHTKDLVRAREDQLWETNPRNRKGVDPLANVVGWYSGCIDQKAWLERKLRCYRRMRPASELRARKGNDALIQAYQLAKALREAEEGPSANVLTPHEQGRLRAAVNEASVLAMSETKQAEAEAAQRKEEREAELKSILASLAAVAPTAMAPQDPQVITPPSTPPPMEPDYVQQLVSLPVYQPALPQIHPDRLAQLNAAPVYEAGVTSWAEEQELRRRRDLKIRRAKAKLEGRYFEEDEPRQDDHRGQWQASGYELL